MFEFKKFEFDPSTSDGTERKPERELPVVTDMVDIKLISDIKPIDIINDVYEPFSIILCIT